MAFFSLKLIFLLKNYFFYPNFFGGQKIVFYANKLEFGLKKGILAPKFSMGRTFRHYVYFLGQNHFKLRPVTPYNKISRCPSFLIAPWEKRDCRLNIFFWQKIVFSLKITPFLLKRCFLNGFLYWKSVIWAKKGIFATQFSMEELFNTMYNF